MAGPVIAGALTYRWLRRRNAAPRDATVRGAIVLILGCLIAFGLAELFEAFSDAVGEVD